MSYKYQVVVEIFQSVYDLPLAKLLFSNYFKSLSHHYLPEKPSSWHIVGIFCHPASALNVWSNLPKWPRCLNVTHLCVTCASRLNQNVLSGTLWTTCRTVVISYNMICAHQCETIIFTVWQCLHGSSQTHTIKPLIQDIWACTEPKKQYTTNKII